MSYCQTFFKLFINKHCFYYMAVCNGPEFQYTCNNVINSYLHSALNSEIIYRMIHLKISRKIGLIWNQILVTMFKIGENYLMSKYAYTSSIRPFFK